MTEEMRQVFVPALVALLTRGEELAGRPLTESEVLRIRDSAQTMEIPLSAMPALLAQRSYHDISASDAWSEWQLYRTGNLDLSLSPDESA